MVILVTAREWSQQYEWSYHYKFAMEAGLAKEIADAIADGRARRHGRRRGGRLRLLDRAAPPPRVSDATYARALKQFGEQGVIDLIGVNGYYSFLAMMMNVSRTEPDTDGVKPLERFPN